jgi:hypothetical protein
VAFGCCNGLLGGSGEARSNHPRTQDGRRQHTNGHGYVERKQQSIWGLRDGAMEPDNSADADNDAHNNRYDRDTTVCPLNRVRP